MKDFFDQKKRFLFLCYYSLSAILIHSLTQTHSLSLSVFLRTKILLSLFSHQHSDTCMRRRLSACSPFVASMLRWQCPPPPTSASKTQLSRPPLPITPRMWGFPRPWRFVDAPLTPSPLAETFSRWRLRTSVTWTTLVRALKAIWMSSWSILKLLVNFETFQNSHYFSFLLFTLFWCQVSCSLHFQSLVIAICMCFWLGVLCYFIAWLIKWCFWMLIFLCIMMDPTFSFCS